MNKFFFACVALLTSSTASAQTFLISGQLDDGDAPANGSFVVDLAIVDGDVELWSEQQTGVVVVDGVFAIDVGAVEPITIDFGVGAALAITIDGDALPPLRLARLQRTAVAQRAAEADHAPNAEHAGAVTEANAATRARLATVGGVSVPFTSITGLPANVVDGDSGLDLAVPVAGNPGVTLTNRTLALDTIDGAKLGVGSVQSGRLGGNAVSGNKIVDGAITGAKVQDGTLVGTNLAVDVTADKVATRAIFEVTVTNCAGLPAGALELTSSCAPPSCGVGNIQNEGCNSTVCQPSRVICANRPIGFVVLP